MLCLLFHLLPFPTSVLVQFLMQEIEDNKELSDINLF